MLPRRSRKSTLWLLFWPPMAVRRFWLCGQPRMSQRPWAGRLAWLAGAFAGCARRTVPRVRSPCRRSNWQNRSGQGRRTLVAPTCRSCVMFYCDACRLRRGWPESGARSRGPCELCGAVERCHDVRTSDLPVRSASSGAPAGRKPRQRQAGSARCTAVSSL